MRGRQREIKQLLREAERESREEDVEELSTKKENLAQKRRYILYTSRALWQWERLNESIEELKK